MKLFRDTKIGKRLGIGFGVAGLLTLLMAVNAWWGLSSLDKAATTREKESMQNALAESIMADFATVRGIVLGYADQTTAQQKMVYQAELDAARASYRKKLANLRDLEDQE